ncbi:MAG: phosphodiester glycosidase family protein [Pseudomonadota bacterium]
MKHPLTFAPVLIAALAGLAACQEQPEGEPVVRTTLGEPDDVTLADADTPVPQPSAEPEEAALPGPSACAPASFEGVALTHCVADPAKHRIKVTYGPGDGSTPYGSLDAYAATAEAETIAFAMNGGAFSDDLKPRGYLVASGARLGELSRGSGDGNFFMKPNGVFYGTGGTWRVRSTDRFYSTVLDRPQFGTQSGPMLLVGGELGGAISEEGTSLAIRNAVGVGPDGKAHFVISGDPLTYSQLARFFRDELKVKDALFLDSKSSSLWDTATGRMDQGRTGPIIVVTKRGS